MAEPAEKFDLLVIGAGINGAGIARDAAGRGLRVALVERGDLAGATSSASSKLIHGGLRYLEHREFRLVAEALAEREVLLSICGHLAWPLEFVLPHAPHLRPRWMLRAGLFLYDRLGGRSSLPRSRAVALDEAPYRGILKPEFRHGFAYADGWVDDARLVVLNVRDAVDRGAILRRGWEVLGATRIADNGAASALWQVEMRELASDRRRQIHCRAIVNAGGPWAEEVHRRLLGTDAHPAPGAQSMPRLKHVKGSHIVVPRLYPGAHAYLLQHPDRRVVFLIPFGAQCTLIGTTDVDVGEDYAQPETSAAEVDYLCELVNRYSHRAIRPADVIWRYSGVRALADDGASDASAVTRDYSLHVDAMTRTDAPLLSVLGGKITTYRALAQTVIDRLAPWFPALRPAWTAQAPLPGADLGPGGYAGFRRSLQARWPRLDPQMLDGLARRHGTLTEIVLDGATAPADLGRDFGGGLHEREVDYLYRREWVAGQPPAAAVEAILWRRTKCGLSMTDEQRKTFLSYVSDHSNLPGRSADAAAV